MSLQSALITIGIILIFVIYIVSAMLEKRKSKSRQVKPGHSGLNDKDEPSLMDLDANDDIVNEIPILDNRLREEMPDSDEEGALHDSELETRQVNPFEYSYNEGPDAQENISSESRHGGSGADDNSYSLDENDIDLEQTGDEVDEVGGDSSEPADHRRRVDSLIESREDRINEEDVEESAPELLEDLVLPGSTSNVDEGSSIELLEELEEFDSAIDSLLEDIPESNLDQHETIQEPLISAGVTDEVDGDIGGDVGDDVYTGVQTDQDMDSDRGMKSPETDSVLIADTSREEIDTPDHLSSESEDSQDLVEIEQCGTSDDNLKQTRDIPVLEVSSRVQDSDTPEDKDSSTKAVDKINDPEISIESRIEVPGSYDEADGNDGAIESGKDTVIEPNGKIEPRLTQMDDEESGRPHEVTSDSRSSNQFVYPEIQGFEKISQIDYWVRIHGARDVGRESVLAQYNESKSSLTRISRIHGIKLPEKNWCDLEDESEDARFGDLIVTIQLADQSGSVDAGELGEFSNLVESLSDGTGRDFAYMAPIESAIQQAHAISDFVRFYDSIFVINIKPEQSEYFDGALINRCATQLGLERSDNNYYVRNKIMGKRKICLYSLANMSESGKFDFENIKDLKTRGVTFFTKPAANRSPGAVFSEMVDTAKAFAGRVKGEAIAPNHEDLSQEDVDQIRQSIEKVADDMEEHGMTPGSDEAMRIF